MSAETMQEAVKKYWPWMAGGVVGLYVLSKVMGGSSTASTQSVGQSATGMDDAQYAAYEQAQSAQQVASTQAAANNAALSDQMQLAQSAATEQNNVDNMTGEDNYIAGLGQLAQAVGNAASTTIAAYSQVPIAGINAVASENNTALMSAASVADKTAAAAGQIGGGMASATQGFVSSAASGTQTALQGASSVTSNTNASNNNASTQQGTALLTTGLMAAAMFA